MKTGLSYNKWAPLATEPADAVPTYGTGLALGGAVAADFTPTFATKPIFTDNVQKTKVSKFIKGDLALSVESLVLDTEAKIFGATYTDGQIVHKSSDVAPFGGFGNVERMLNVDTNAEFYRAKFYPKIQCERGADNARTAEEEITAEPTPISALAYQPKFGGYEYKQDFTDEAQAKLYIDAKLGITAAFEVSVQVQNADTGDSATPGGVTMVETGESFVLTVAGTPAALYDNGVESKASISAGKYTIAEIAAAHTIAVIF